MHTIGAGCSGALKARPEVGHVRRSNLFAERPFVPFAICMSNRERCTIRYPECVAIGMHRLIIAFPKDHDRFVICTLIRVKAVQELEAS